MILNQLNFGYLKGDTDGDGYLSASDALVLRKYLAKINTTDIYLQAADINGDGHVDAKDQYELRIKLAA